MSSGSDKGGNDARGSRLDKRRRELLAQRLQAARATNTTAPTAIPRAAHDATRYASAEQARLWFLGRLYPDSPAYHMHVALRLEGPIDVDRIEPALKSLQSRHESLRTLFRHADGELLQVVAEHPALDFPGVETSDEPGWRSAALEAIRTPFDTEHGPLFRARLYCIGADRHVLLLIVHHLICDEWSLNLMLKEFGRTYAAYGHGAASDDEAEEALRYADYAAWQRGRPAEERARGVDWWREQLAGELPVIAMPTDRPRPRRQSLRGAVCERRLDGTTTAGLERLARQEGVTLNMVSLAAFVALLHRYTGQDNLLVGTPVANRGRAGTEGIVGLFINTLLLRARPQPKKSFAALLREVRDTTLAALSHQDVQLEDLVRALAPERDLSQNPLFQVMFVYQNDDAESLALPGVRCGIERLDAGVAKFDLTMFVAPAQGCLNLQAEYATDLYEPATIDALLGAYAQLLSAVAEQPGCELAALPLLDEQASEALVRDGRGAALERPPAATWLAGFAACVRNAPDAIAVDDGEVTLSYRDLERQVAGIAAQLSRMGAGPGTAVAVFLPRGNAHLAALIGVQWAGAAYVPLDPDYPASRTATILASLAEEMGTPLVLTSAMHADDPALAGARVADIAVAAANDGGPAQDDLPAPDDIAYLIFTSGSTGRPKGVVVSHGNLASSNAARIQHYQTPVVRYLLLSSFAFDSSAAGIYWTLATGGTLFIAPGGTARDPREIARLVLRAGITETLLLPSVYEMLLEVADGAALSSLRRVIVAGEAARPTLALHHADVLPDTALYNEYGPTEATVWATVARCDDDPEAGMPVGRPIPGTQLYLVDAQDRLVPRGALGRLLISGPGVAQGYLGRNDPAFVADPVCPTDARTYRSGDLMRLRGTTLEFRGRDDEQIKIRGHRVEPGEIEAVLRLHDAIADAAVIDTPASSGAARLVAYVVVSGTPAAQAGELRGFLRERLPDFMVPSAFVVLDALPRTANGKIDRRHLPPPDAAPTAAPAAAPTEHGVSGDPVFDTLREIWVRLLGCPVEAGDHFFELGGHSLLGVSMTIEAERRLGTTLPLALLFEYPRLGDFAARARLSAVDATNRYVIPIRREGDRPPLFCVHGGARMLARHLDPDQPLYLAYHDTHADLAEAGSVESIAASYLAEIRAIQPSGPLYLLGFSFGGMIAWEIACRLREQGEPVAMLALCDPPPLMGTTIGGYRSRRKWQELSSQPGLSGKLRYAVQEPFRILARRINALGLRLLGSWYERTMRSWLVGPRLRNAVLGAGVALLALNWLLLALPQWRPLAEPLPMAPGSVFEQSFVTDNSEMHSVQFELSRSLSQAVLDRTALARKEAPEVSMQWSVSTGGERIVGGDARGYLYLDAGARSLPGKLRRILLGMPYGHDRLYRYTLGTLGERTVARGLGRFRAEAGIPYSLRMELGDGWQALADGRPRAVVRPSRRFAESIYARTLPLGYSGLGLIVLAGLLRVLAALRSRQTMPANLVAFRNLQHNLRLSNRFRYRDYDGDVDLILPDDGDEVIRHKRDAWSRIVRGDLSVRICAGIGRHLDMIDTEKGRGVAEIIAGLLARRRAQKPPQ